MGFNRDPHLRLLMHYAEHIFDFRPGLRFSADQGPRSVPIHSTNVRFPPILQHALAFFAGVWTEWTSVRKLKEGETTNDLFGFLTTEANAVVAEIHPKAMPVILTRPDEGETWLTAPADEAMDLQWPFPDDALRIVARGEKRDHMQHPNKLDAARREPIRRLLDLLDRPVIAVVEEPLGAALRRPGFPCMRALRTPTSSSNRRAASQHSRRGSSAGSRRSWASRSPALPPAVFFFRSTVWR